MPVTRRELLQSVFLARGGAASMVREQDQHHRITPRDPDQVSPRMRDEVRAALSQPCRNPRGFDPGGFVHSFDRGEVSRTRGGLVTREFRIVARDADLEVAPGITVRAWTYNGSVPGPTLRCTVGDRVKVHFENASIAEHTIHFHGIHAANMDGVAEVVAPGAHYTYEFIAEPAGLQFYHCHVTPIALHMSRGLFGAFVIDPVRPAPSAAELVLISHGWDIDFDGTNELYAYNGPANFYRDNPIQISRGQRVRLYLVNALEYESVSSFHLHGNFFDFFAAELKRRPDGCTDVVTLGQAERRILEFTYPHHGRFMFHPHQNGVAEGGCMGHFDVVRQ